MTPGAVNIKGGSKEPLSINFDDKLGVTLKSPKNLNLNVDDDIIIKTPANIENSIFNNLKKECGLEHCFIHSGNEVEAVFYLIFIAANIMQLFLYRQLKKQFSTQREIIRLLLKGLYLIKYKSELVFNST